MEQSTKTLYRLLNEDAKAWWYFRRLREWGQVAEARAKERESIRRCIEHVREAAWSSGYLVLTEDNRFILTISNRTVLSGGGTVQHYQRLCEYFNVPVFDLRKSPEGNALMWKEPLDAADRIAYYKEKLNGTHS